MHKIAYKISIATISLLALSAIYFVYSVLTARFEVNQPLVATKREVVRGDSQVLNFDYCTNVKANINYQLIDGQIIDLAQETSVSGCGTVPKNILMPPTINKGAYKLRVIASYKVFWVVYKRQYDTEYFTVK